MVCRDYQLINIDNISKETPFTHFRDLYLSALNNSQNNIEAAAISTVCKENKPSSRFVNIKYINNSFIFFSNYKSNKAKDLELNKNACILFFWNNISTQIRIEGYVIKSDSIFSDDHFSQRSFSKNIAALISNQSSIIDSHESLLERYNNAYEASFKEDIKRPSYWGGYELVPEIFEFWHGSDFRLNMRTKYTKQNKNWVKTFLES